MKSDGNSARTSCIKVSGVKLPKILTYEKVISYYFTNLNRFEKRNNLLVSKNFRYFHS